MNEEMSPEDSARLSEIDAEIERRDMERLSEIETELASRDTGYTGSIWKGFNQGVGGVMRGIGGLAEMAGVPNDINAKANARAEELDRLYPTYATSKKVTAGATNLITQMVPTLATGWVGAGSYLFGSNLGQSYSDLKSQGATDTEAYLGGAAIATTDTIVDSIPIARFLPNGAVSRVVTGGALSGAGNASTAYSQAWIEQNVANIDTPLHGGDIDNEAILRGGIGLLGGGATAITMRGANTSRLKVDKKDVDGFVDILNNIEEPSLQARTQNDLNNPDTLATPKEPVDNFNVVLPESQTPDIVPTIENQPSIIDHLIVNNAPSSKDVLDEISKSGASDSILAASERVSGRPIPKPNYDEVYKSIDNIPEEIKPAVVNQVINSPIIKGVNDLDVIDSPASIRNAYDDGFNDNPSGSPFSYEVDLNDPSASLFLDKKSRVAKLKNNERGIIDFGFAEEATAKVANKVKQRISDVFNKDTIDQFADDLTFVQPKLFDSKIRRAIARMEYKMNLSEQGAGIFAKYLDRARESNIHINEAIDKSKKYFALDAPREKRVNAFLEAARIANRKKTVDFSPSGLKKAGLDDIEIGAIQAVRETTDYFFNQFRHADLKKTEEAYLKKNPNADREDVLDVLRQRETAVNELYDPAYIPFGREGDHSVRILKDDTDLAEVKNDTSKLSQNTEAFHLFSNEKEALAFVKEINKSGKNKNLIKYEKIRKKDRDIKSTLPVSMQVNLDALDEFTKRSEFGGPIRGAKKHLVHATLVKGYSTDFRKNLADYIVSMSSYVADTNVRRDINAHLEDLRVKTKASGGLYSEVRKYVDYQDGNNEAWAKNIRKYLAFMHLSASVSTAAVNLSTAITTTLPNVARHLDGDLVATSKLYSKSMLDTKSYLSNIVTKGKFKGIQDKELLDLLSLKMKDGTLSDTGFKQEFGISSHTDKISNGLFYMFSTAEKFVRVNAYINGYHLAKAKGLKHVDDFATTFVRQTQFDYSKVSRASFGRGEIGALLSTFRSFGHNYMGFMKDLLSEKQFKAFAVAAVAQISVGGLASVPIVGGILKAFISAGYDPQDSVKEFFGDNDVVDLIVDFAAKGIPRLLGADTSMALASNELPDLEKGLALGVGKYIGGVMWGELERYNKWKTIMDKNPSAYSEKSLRAFTEAITPKFIQRAARAGYALADDGYFTNAYGARMVDPENPSQSLRLTVPEMILVAGGFLPTRISQTYEISQTVYRLNQLRNQSYNKEYANALFNKDYARAAAIEQKALDNGKEINFNQADDYLYQFNNPIEALTANTRKDKKEEVLKEIYRHAKVR
jgi:hypothetical protein